MKNSIWYYSVVLFAILVTGGCAQKAKPGPCKEVEPIPNFNFKKYLGHWYEFARTARVFEDDKSCMQFDYSNVSDDGNLLRINRLYKSHREKYNETSFIFFNKETGEGRTTDGYPFTVVNINYRSYAVIYGCVNNGDTHKEILWVITRDRNPVDVIHIKAVDTAKKFGINPADLIITSQSYCPKSFNDAKQI